MKKQMLSAFARKFFLGNIMAAMLFLSANASVSPVHFNFEPTKNNKANITYKGIDSNDYLTFQVVYNNPTGSTFKLVITDTKGELFFSENYKELAFSKTFKLYKEDISKLNFSIRDAKTGESENFDVVISESVTEKVAVSRKN
ncbi:MAG: hypothetical protein EAZ12_08335 [Sphingobacteriia bacterium]|jgi:hypothetical protein|nr:MAG: hypothetical protein EAZ12_08335 [Sphingobacteriia bacterium]